MSDPIKEINVMELLLKISNDVSSIKTDMDNLKKNQDREKENTTKEIEDVRSDLQKEIDDLGKKLNTVTEDVDTLKRAEEKRDAKKWRTVMAFACTALGSMFIAKLPEIIRLLIVAFATK